MDITNFIFVLVFALFGIFWMTTLICFAVDEIDAAVNGEKAVKRREQMFKNKFFTMCFCYVMSVVAAILLVSHLLVKAQA